MYSSSNNGNYPTDSGFLGAGRSDALNNAIRPYFAEMPGDVQDNGGPTPANYYYFIPDNNCFGVGEVFPTVHVLDIESNREEYLQNPCTPSGSTEGGANVADHLFIIR